MAPHINSPTSDVEIEQAPRPTCPKRASAPTAKVLSADNAADLELSSHRKAHEAVAAKCKALVIDDDEPSAPPDQATKKCVHKCMLDEFVPDNDNTSATASPVKRANKHIQKCMTDALASVDVIDAEGFLEDIEVLDIDELVKPRREQCSCDIDVLFSASYLKDGKRYRDCDACT
ncbi:uncharacterized protein HD556DRAFT_1439910 [Suillus plorans]|uniref:Uncharacterized protein n=1 Tax=Suillus plorans TaxID=116603 RepID=A0A9P7DN08_9AGAM|nr:uncharacterized protein HD556DRAFT_1439910 [Suillus plorans]KAG1798855.1 hypothetical protein HD556DRAFT_1439910 [Suillus plorans]